MSTEWHTDVLACFVNKECYEYRVAYLGFLTSKEIDHMAAAGRNTNFKNITIIFWSSLYLSQ
jgi:hypothetical protein